MKKIKIIISDFLFRAAIYFDPRLPRYNDLATYDIWIYGSSIIKVIDPRELFVDPEVAAKKNKK